MTSPWDPLRPSNEGRLCLPLSADVLVGPIVRGPIESSTVWRTVSIPRGRSTSDQRKARPRQLSSRRRRADAPAHGPFHASSQGQGFDLGMDRTGRFSLVQLGQAPRSHGAGVLSDRLVPYRPAQDTSQHADSLDHLRRRYTVLVHVGDPVVDVARLDPSDRHSAEPRLDSQPPGRRIIDPSGGLARLQ
jgi:hypothetical protein